MKKKFKAVSLAAIMAMVFMLTGCVPGMDKNGLTSQPRTPSKKPVKVELTRNAPKYEIRIEETCVRKVSNWRVQHGLSPIKITSHRAVKNGKIVRKAISRGVLGGLINIVSAPVVMAGAVFLPAPSQQKTADTQEAMQQLRQCKRELMFDWNKRQYEQHISSTY